MRPEPGEVGWAVVKEPGDARHLAATTLWDAEDRGRAETMARLVGPEYGGRTQVALVVAADHPDLERVLEMLGVPR